MKLEQYWMKLIKQWRLIVISFILVGIGANIGSKLITPLYQSTTLIEVAFHSSGSSQADYNNVLASEQLVQTETLLAVSYPVLREVAMHYSGLSEEQLSKEVTATPKFNTQLFEIDVLDHNPGRAAALANDIATTLIKQQNQEIQQDTLLSQRQIQQDIQSTQQQIDNITSRIAALQAEKGNEVEIGTLQGRLNILQEHYGSLLAQLGSVEVQNSSFLRLAQPAQLAGSPAQPNVLLNTVAGLVAGLLFGLLLALLFERLDTRIRTPEALAQLLDWPILAAVKYLHPSKEEELVNPPAYNDNVEAYRMLRTNIGFSLIDKPLRSIIVTSAAPKEGKSTIAANLAIFTANAGKNTLLVDADLHYPTVHEKFRLPVDSMGLSNAIVAFSQAQFDAARQSKQQQSSASPLSNFSLEPFIHAVGIPNLRIMPSGPLPPNPTELLDSKAMERLLITIEDYGAEMIIFDGPPVIGLSDASIVASKVDGIIVVVDITKAKKQSLMQLKAILTHTRTSVLGCVINKQRQMRGGNPYSYYYRTAEEEHDVQNAKIPVVSSTSVLSMARNHKEE